MYIYWKFFPVRASNTQTNARIKVHKTKEIKHYIAILLQFFCVSCSTNPCIRVLLLAAIFAYFQFLFLLQNQFEEDENKWLNKYLPEKTSLFTLFCCCCFSHFFALSHFTSFYYGNSCVYIQFVYICVLNRKMWGGNKNKYVYIEEEVEVHYNDGWMAMKKLGSWTNAH